MVETPCAFCTSTPANNVHKIWSRRLEKFNEVKLCDKCYKMAQK